MLYQSSNLRNVDLDYTYGEGVAIELKPGMGWAIYSDNGPGGPCGQSMRTTMPHITLFTWPDENLMLEYLKNAKWRNKKHVLVYGVVDGYTSGAVANVCLYTR